MLPIGNILHMANTNRKHAASATEHYRTGEHSLTRKEYEKLLDACSSIEDELMIKVAVGLGLRRYDLTHIMIADIDLEQENTLSYHEQKKGGRIRTVFISAKLHQIIVKYLKTIPKGQKKLFAFSDKTAYNRLQKICDIAGIPRRPFHALRATCIKFHQAAGWRDEETAELVGDTIRVIQEHYATPSRSEMQEATATTEVI